MNDRLESTSMPGPADAAGDDPELSKTDLREAFAAWLATVPDIPHARLGEGGDHGDTGEPLEPLYSGSNVEIDELPDLGLPGSYPFVRGAYRTGYRERPWFMTQYAGFGTAETTNERWRSLLAAGQTAVSLAFDLPSHLGYDSDSEVAEHEVGKAGVAVDSLADFEVLFEGIDLGRVPATFNTAAIAPIVVAMFIATAELKGIDPAKLRGTVTNDPLSSVFRGTTALPSPAGVRLACDVIEYCATAMPRFTPINVQGVYMRSVGATKAQEAGYAVAFAMEYLESLLKRGIPIDSVAGRFSFFFQCDSHFFEEAAKFRAARAVWAQLLRDRFDAPEAVQRLRATGVSAARCFTREEPEINLIRGAYSALGCALGGVQGMWISGYDEAYATPTEHASRLALRTMQILAEETGVRAAIDPMGGSWFLEELTARMRRQILAHVAEVDGHGGALVAADEGYLRSRMQGNDLAWLRERAAGERPIVGHNVYVADGADDREPEFQRFDPSLAEEQIARLRRVRSERDEAAVRTALAGVRRAMESSTNTMPAIIEAVRRYATVGEIMACAREVFGEWAEPAA
jgi:methylmalonyl-CoA mutase N-terminal domain/subunit